MTAETAERTAEAEIREGVERWRKAVLARDLDAIMSHYAPDVLAFDAISQLQFKGFDAYRKHWAACLSMCQEGMSIFEVHDLNVVAGDNVAFATALTHCGATTEDGEEKAGWMRMTVGYQKRDGRWMVAHEHFSAPFDIETFKILDLAP